MTSRTPVKINIRPWFQDHCFGGKIVMPAVETMLLLAAEVAKSHPEIDIRVMKNVRFAKLLEIPPGIKKVAALVEYISNPDGQVQVELFSRVKIKAVTRLKEHGTVLFSHAAGSNVNVPVINPKPLSDPVREVEADRIYRELVPFGPAYRTLQEKLFLSQQDAWGTLKAPFLPDTNGMQEIIGSPFPLDGALHAACVHGQQFVDFVPFPVEIGRRIINRPTQPGGSYATKAILISRTKDELVYDLGIFDHEKQVYETVTDIRMRDVSGGRIKPPTWMKIKK